MGSFKYLDEILTTKTNGIHTAYLAKVLSVNGSTAKIQPLGLVNNSDGTTSPQSVLTAIPICEHVKHFSLVKQTLSVTEGSINPATHPPDENVGHVKIEPIRAGDVVLCVVCERNISEAKSGRNAATPYGTHNMSDSVIVGVI